MQQPLLGLRMAGGSKVAVVAGLCCDGAINPPKALASDDGNSRRLKIDRLLMRDVADDQINAGE